jgi:hypothetical protein
MPEHNSFLAGLGGVLMILGIVSLVFVLLANCTKTILKPALISVFFIVIGSVLNLLFRTS